MGNRGLTSSALARVASFRDRHGNPVFHVKPPATAQSLDALTAASSQDHEDSDGPPHLRQRLYELPGEGDHTPVGIHKPPPRPAAGRTSELTGVRRHLR